MFALVLIFFRYGDRVPFVVVSGNPKSRLIDLVVHPDHFLAKQNELKIHAQYYITKQIIPTLNRVFNLLGVDVGKWFFEMPKTTRDFRYFRLFATKLLRILSYLHMVQLSISRPQLHIDSFKRRIDSYYLTQHCPVCDSICKPGYVCDGCSKAPQFATLIMLDRYE